MYLRENKFGLEIIRFTIFLSSFKKHKLIFEKKSKRLWLLRHDSSYFLWRCLLCQVRSLDQVESKRMMETWLNKVVWLMLYRKPEQMIAVFPSGLQIFLSASLKVPLFPHMLPKNITSPWFQNYSVLEKVCVMMPGFGTFHHLNGQQLTLQLFTAKCAWPHLLFALISIRNPPDTNHHHEAAKPMKGSPLSSVGVDRSFVCPCFISWFNTWSHRAADSALPHSLQDSCLALSCCFSIPFRWRTPLWWVGHKIFYSSGTCYWI